MICALVNGVQTCALPIFLYLPPGELDTIIALYDSEGNIVALTDDTASSQGDVGSSVSLFVEESGTYYLEIIAYDNLTTEDQQIGGHVNTAQALDSENFRSERSSLEEECDGPCGLPRSAYNKK